MFIFFEDGDWKMLIIFRLVMINQSIYKQSLIKKINFYIFGKY